MYLIHKAKKIKKVKNCKIKKVQTKRFQLFNPDDGKQPKTFGLNFLILQFLTFLTFLALCMRIHIMLTAFDSYVQEEVA